MKYTLLFICIFFLFTRLYKISEIPQSVYWDEASIGYNAYSISQTGKDEWGNFLPLHFRAFGEFKLPVYIYSVVPFVKIFGLNEFSVRFPAVLFSLGVVILTYFLAKKLTGKDSIGLWSSFFVSISPWFFIFSRTGYEATAGLMFYLLAIYLFLGFAERKWFIFFSAACFILSAYSYNSFRIIAPLAILTLILLQAKSFLVSFKKAIIPITFSLVIVLLSIAPIYRLYVYDAGISRLQAVGGVNITSFAKNYISHFSPNFLLVGDKNIRSQQPGFGQIFPLDFLLIPLGLLCLLTSKSKYGLLPLILILIGPIPAAITKESPHALRVISMVPFMAIISAFGTDKLQQWVKKSSVATLTISIIFMAFFINYFLNFLYVYPLQSQKEWQHEYKKIYEDFGKEFYQYNRIIISDKYAQPYIFTLFYLKYDPQKFRQEVIRNNVSEWGFSTVKKFGKFEFKKIPGLFIFEKYNE